MTTKRKPYVRPMPSTWWKKLPFYRFYMLREGTAVPTVWFSIVLIYGLFALKHGAESWAGYIGFLQNPIVVILKGEKMGPEPIIKGLWVVTAVVTVVILFVALFW